MLATVVLYPLGCLSIDSIKWPRSPARQEPFHWRVQTRLNAQKRAGDVVIWFWPVLGSCISIHALNQPAILLTEYS